MYFPLVFLLLMSQHYKECRGAQIVYKTTNIQCFPNPKYIENASCVIKAINWNKAVANMDGDIKTSIRNVSIHMVAFKKGYNNRYHPFLVDVKFNFCNIISKKNFLGYGKILYQIVKPFSNVNHSCPYTGHLIARDLFIEETNVPILPLGFYLFTMEFTEEFPQKASEHVGLAKFYIEAMEMVERRQKKPKL